MVNNGVSGIQYRFRLESHMHNKTNDSFDKY